jgi:hypothetical protein
MFRHLEGPQALPTKAPCAAPWELASFPFLGSRLTLNSAEKGSAMPGVSSGHCDKHVQGGPHMPLNHTSTFIG